MQKVIAVDDLKDGLIDDNIQKSFGEILADIQNKEKPAESKRILTAKFVFMPSSDRQQAKLTVETHVMLAPNRPVGTMLFFEEKGDQLIAFDRDPNQQTLPAND